MRLREYSGNFFRGSGKTGRESTGVGFGNGGRGGLVLDFGEDGGRNPRPTGNAGVRGTPRWRQDAGNNEGFITAGTPFGMTHH